MSIGAEVCITVEKAVDNDLSSEMLAYRTRKAGPLMTTGTIPHLTTPEIVQSKDPEVNWNIQVYSLLFFLSFYHSLYLYHINY